jgi:CheY-like chemotaxis protein
VRVSRVEVKFNNDESQQILSALSTAAVPCEGEIGRCKGDHYVHRTPHALARRIPMTTKNKTTGTSRVTLLYLDHAPESQDILGQLLLHRYRDHNVIVAENGLEGWRIINGFKPEILLLDPYMYEPIGFGLMRELKKSENRPYVVVVSGHTDVEKIEESIAAGANGYVTKPVNLVYLYRLLDNLIKSIILQRSRSMEDSIVLHQLFLV